MLHSAEIRWLFEGSVDPVVQHRFDESTLGHEEDPRVDSYLVLPGCTTTVVKVRKGHIEVKAQTSLPQLVGDENGIKGVSGTWVKWSSSLAGAPILQERQGPETWLQVEQSRSLRLFALEWLDRLGCIPDR